MPTDIINFTDNFNDNTISTSWVTDGNAAEVLEQNQRMEISHTAASEYNGLIASTPYSLVGRYVYVNVVDAGNQTLASHEVIFGVRLGNTTQDTLYFTTNGGNLSAYKKINSTAIQVGSSLTYSSTTHAWYRLRENLGTIYWDTADNVGNWVNRWSCTSPFPVTAIKPILQSGCYALEVSGSFGYFDNFNIGAEDDLDPDTNKNAMNVAVDDGDYFVQYGSEQMIQEFKKKWTNNTDQPTFSWKGRTTYDTRISPIIMQIYNVNSASWETFMTDNTVPADTDFACSYTQKTNVSNYYDSNNVVAFRVYQQVI